MNEEYLSRQQTADLLGVSVRTIDGMIKNKSIPHSRISMSDKNGRVIFIKSEIQNWMKEKTILPQ
jgi:excisionase family DNA binding protein